MTSLQPWSYCASIAVKATAKRAFDFMADGNKQSDWALGSWNRKQISADVFFGTSLLDGSEEYIRLVPREDLLLVDYYCGPAPESLTWVVEARIVPGELIGLGPQMSLINMTTWRSANADPAYWQMIEHVWQTEIHLIKQLIERGG
jgi:hypothetical protein